ncbi:hypothetical protein NEUTE1DRAFT_76779 [Neurospora tetrasperma FGSC 2508]|uniref:Ilp is an apoptosis inhibitor n=1 Tax=Neurospora tetrasperma (strain FGSC 2508 / ATCC MYA-4615 / P0657) TaxID=510951 RepID=F8MBA9_NEUT8|nr:uncharacterized protein NEUTE1DRAFT_76779 [Neurospora tetrasperma FGSC 2508]EGO61074.1 hypothetical protein NEUTE1DRAFT_76779 [Neurospora tetrasperma FGSC 2508]EGZ74921.1 hypothetical protein NEUTE2DRAFT_82737 [Neurospora tetrasperma FGSC 2509]
MAFPQPGGPAFRHAQSFADAQSQFDILEWHPYFMSCMRYFLDHAQYHGPVQALAGFINIRLPFQKPNPVLSSQTVRPPPELEASCARGAAGKAPVGGYGLQSYASVNLIPYIRRLVATGYDFPGVLHGFFGDDWEAGIGPLHENERRNYLFAAKSSNWLKVKAAYDMNEEESIPFLKPLRDATEREIVLAERSWSEWLAMQDWMLGPRAPDVQQANGNGNGNNANGGRMQGIKREGD